MKFPLISKELAAQIEQVDIDYTLSRLGGMQAATGNPLGIEIKPFGQATAFLIRAWPDFWYGNRVLGLIRKLYGGNWNNGPQIHTDRHRFFLISHFFFIIWAYLCPSVDSC